MDAKTIMRIKPELTRFLDQFDDCFGRTNTRRYLDLYVEGQLSDLHRKSVEPMADAFGEPPRNLQQFLSLFRWDEVAAGDRLQQYVAHRHTHPHSMGVIGRDRFYQERRQDRLSSINTVTPWVNSKAASSACIWGILQKDG